MAKATVAALRRQGSSKKSTKKSTKVVNISGDAAALERMVISRGPGAKARTIGNKSIAGAIGPKANAIASGSDSVAVAGGHGAHAGLEKGDDSAAVAAAGLGCFAQVSDGFADMAAVGPGATAISHSEHVAAVANGYGAFAISTVPKGTAISIGHEPAAMAGWNGYLIFIDISGTEPAVKVVKAALCEEGTVRPGVPYFWKAGMDRPAVDTHRMELKPIG